MFEIIFYNSFTVSSNCFQFLILTAKKTTPTFCLTQDRRWGKTIWSQSSIKFQLIRFSGSSISAVSNTLATSHMWLLVFVFVAIPITLKLKITVLFVSNLWKDAYDIKILANFWIHTLVFGVLILLFNESLVYNWKCGYLSIPVATNVASYEILLDTAGLFPLLVKHRCHILLPHCVAVGQNKPITS